VIAISKRRVRQSSIRFPSVVGAGASIVHSDSRCYRTDGNDSAPLSRSPLYFSCWAACLSEWACLCLFRCTNHFLCQKTIDGDASKNARWIWPGKSTAIVHVADVDVDVDVPVDVAVDNDDVVVAVASA